MIGAGDELRFGEATASVLSPPPLANTNAPSRNNDSIVLCLRLGRRALLLTGDIEMAGEERMLRANENLLVDVVKVAHHGSKTSSIPPLIAATEPRFAVVSVGKISIFGHPSPEVVERWRAAGAQVLTTGNSGTITLTTDGRDLELETFVAEVAGSSVYRIRTVKLTLPALLGAVWLRFPVKVHLTFVTRRS